MKYIQGNPRDQLVLFSEKLDDIISDNNPVRFIDAYVDTLDVKELGFKIPEMNTGRPPYLPCLLLKIYIYGYLNKLRGTRKLEKECHRNIELIWLTEQLAPDFKTIADFRKDNRKGIRNIFKEFLKLCKKLNLIDYKLIALDGSKFRSRNSTKNIYQRKNIEKLEKKIDEKINEYLQEMDKTDEREKDEYEILSRGLGERIKNLKKKKEKIRGIKEIFQEEPEKDVYFAGDPDSCFQKTDGKLRPAYNGQTAVDSKNKLIIVNDVIDTCDNQQLSPMVKKIKEEREEADESLQSTVVADAGYYNEKDIMEIEKEETIDSYVSNPRDGKTSEKSGKSKKEKMPSKGYEKEDFKYVAERDEFICPAGKVLKRGSLAKGTHEGSGLKLYRYHCKECRLCESKKHCTSSKKGRTIKASGFTKELREYREKTNTEEGKSILRKRRELAEHPFGTIKEVFGYKTVSQKGLENAKSEFSFITFIYNLKRVLNIVPLSLLIAAIK